MAGDQNLGLLNMIAQLAAIGALPIGNSPRSMFGDIGARSKQGPTPSLYWDARHPTRGGTGRIEAAGVAPTPDHYRLTGSMQEALQALRMGEPPIVYPWNFEGIDPGTIDPGSTMFDLLRKLQEEQYATGFQGTTEPLFIQGPGGLTVNPYWGGQ